MSDEPKIVVSPPGTVNKGGWLSTLRHFLFPLVAGSAVAALQTAQTGNFDLHQMQSAAVTAGIAGVIGLLRQTITTQVHVDQ